MDREHWFELLIAPIWNRNIHGLNIELDLDTLLIAPIWNRNLQELPRKLFQFHLLIAPIWNRNFYTSWK